MQRSCKSRSNTEIIDPQLQYWRISYLTPMAFVNLLSVSSSGALKAC
jgi:hypothetical protein